jgi:hypothetical protein
MNKLFYLRCMKLIVENFNSLKFCFELPLCILYSGQSNFKSETEF